MLPIYGGAQVEEGGSSRDCGRVYTKRHRVSIRQPDPPARQEGSSQDALLAFCPFPVTLVEQAVRDDLRAKARANMVAAHQWVLTRF